MSGQDDSFFSRWSRRKAQVRQGASPSVAELVEPVPAPAQPVEPSATSAPKAGIPDDPQGAGPESPRPPPPTMEDVQALTPESDFSRFLAPEVDAQVKNSAMKKLFADPHFNVMDGLDTYIDDYHTPDPLPKALLRQLVQARSLGLLDDEMPEQPVPLPATPPAVVERDDEVQAEAEADPPDPEASADADMSTPSSVEDGGGALPSASGEPQPSADKSSPES